MIKNLVILFFVGTLCLPGAKGKTKFSNEIDRLIFEGSDVFDDWVFIPDLQSNPDECASNRFQWDGGNFICLRVDRLNLIRAQRDFHFATQEWYRLQVIAKDAYSIMDELQRIARGECQKQGKKFSEQLADCEGTLTE